MNYDIVENNIKIGNKIIYGVDKDIIKIIHNLEEQLEHCYCERTDCFGRIKDSKQYDSLVQKVENQQQEFIKYLKQCIENEEYCYLAEKQEDRVRKDILEEILAKYKEIIGVKDE